MTQFNHFKYKNNTLHCEDVSVQTITDQQGSPVYIYSYQAIVDQYQKLTNAFKDWDHLICYSVKANSNIAIMRTLFNEGCSADVVSGGELRRAIKAGCDPKKTVYSGVGKTSEEIHFALQTGIMQFNIESEPELLNIQRIAAFLDKRAPIAIRVNPDVDAKTHPYISTGLKKNKFGVSHTRVLDLYQKAKGLSHIDITGISCHIGSQLTETSPFRDAMTRIRELILQLKDINIAIQHIDVGGGLGILYKDETIDPVETYASAIMDPLKDLGCQIVLEPGRFIVGNAGILVTKVLYLKEGVDDHHFTIVDAAFNDLKRPMLYNAWHEILPVTQDAARGSITTNIEGPICETTDCFAKNRAVQRPEQGDLLALMSTGAYGMSMSSTYNSRGCPVEILVKGHEYHVIKKADQLEDFTGRERLPDFLNIGQEC